MKSPILHGVLFVTVALLLGPTVRSAELTVSDEVTAKSPGNLAYNFGHYFPGSNTSDWWRYSRASGARIFLSAAHFNVSGTLRPGESFIGTEAGFVNRREALRDDPLNTDYINWPVIEDRFNTPLSGRNRIVPDYALSEIHRLGGTILAQTTVTENAFPIEDEADWYGKWILWRTYYSIAFYLAREFDVERFSSHNEPNHPHSFIEPDSWHMRLQLASDAAQSALEDANALYGKSLEPRFTAPVTAGGGLGSGFDDYGLVALKQIGTNFLGQTPDGHQNFHMYAYQSYNHSPSGFAQRFRDVREEVHAVTPDGIAPLPFAITEFNVHTGARYDDMPESSDTLSKAVRFGGIVSQLAANGMDELYAFKFGLTGWESSSSNNFPVQKNAMLSVDNDNEPYNYGTMNRSGEVYRLFNKGFAPGRELLAHSLSGSGADDLDILVGRDLESGYHYIFSVNESTSAIPMEIDLSPLGIPDGTPVIIEDVSQWRRGLIRSFETVEMGSIEPGSQPGRTAWLISIPPESHAHTLPVTQEVMVRDGAHADTNFGEEPEVYARNDASSADQRAVAFLQFELPEDWNPNDLALAVLAVPVAPIDGDSETVHAHLYGIDNHHWDESTLTWNDAPNLRRNVPPGNRIRHGVVNEAGDTAHILGQLTISGSPNTRRVDVTDYLARQDGNQASFLIAQDPRWDVDIRVETIPGSWDDLQQGDDQPDGMRLRTRRELDSPEDAAQLILFRRTVSTVDYVTWIASFFQDKVLVADDFAYPDGPLQGSGDWQRGPSSPTSDNPSDYIAISDQAVRFDWTTDDPINNLVRNLWPPEASVDDGMIYGIFDFTARQAPQAEDDVRPGFFSFGNANGNQQRGFVGIRRGSEPDTFQLGISPSSQLGGNFTFAPRDLGLDTAYRVRVGFNVESQDTSLWIDSADPASGPVLNVAASGDNSGIRRVNLRLYNSDGDAGTTDLGIFELDNLTVTTLDRAWTQPGANPAGDGLSNILKFALGLDPRVPAGPDAPRIFKDETGQAHFRYTRNPLADGVELAVEASDDLAEWSSHDAVPITEYHDDREQVFLPLPVDEGDDRLFLRLRATLVPP